MKLRLTLITILFLCVFSQAQKVLHVSTIPSNTDIYVGLIKADHADKPDYTSPAIIPISDEENLHGEILLHLFRPDFNDTTIRVKLSQGDTSYLIVSMRPTYDAALQDEQERILSKRSRRSFGHKLMFASAIPFLVGGTASLITLYQIEQANDAKRKAEKTYIMNSKERERALDDFNDSKDKAKTAQKTTYTSLIVGASFLTLGFILSF